MPDVTIYTKVGCPHCKAAMDYYDGNNVEYKEIDVHNVPGAAEKAEKLAGGRRMVPIIVADGEVSAGYNGGH